LAVSSSKWNVVCHFLDGVFFSAALITFSAEMVIPTMIAELSDSALMLGLVPLITQACWILPQTFYAKKIEGLAYKKPAVLLCAFLGRAGWVVFLASLFVHWGPGFTLPVFFVVMVSNGLGSGLVMPIWADWYAKTVPENMWGRLLGMRAAAPAVLGVGLGKLIQWIVDVRPAPQRYQILLILTIAFYALSFVSVMLVKEERHEGLPTQDGKSWAGYFRDLGLILARQRDFRVFLIAAVLLTVPTAVMATFLTKYGLTSAGAGSGVAGTFTMFYFAAMAVGSLAGGLISDHKGVLVPFRVFPLFVAGGCAVSAVSPNWMVVSGAWALLGFAWGMRIVAFLPAVFSFAEPHRRPSYSSVLFTALGGTAAVLPPLMGMVKDARVLDFPHIFLLCGVTALAGWFLLLRIPSAKAPASCGGAGSF